MKIGILGIQGDYNLHKIALDKLNVKTILVRDVETLINCNSLIIPGGESTTISLLLNKYNLINPIIEFSKKNTIFGTCAGAIIMSKLSHDPKISNLGLIDLNTSRNSWGSQIDSFSDFIELDESVILKKKFFASFIRAPKFYKINKSCKILGKYKNEPVLIRNDNHLVSSFHPEIGNNLMIYKYYLNMINE